MKILIISGTPKKDGITHSMVTTAFEAASEAEIIHLSDYSLHVCKMCGDGWGTCLKEHYCQFDDDAFNDLQKKVNDADGYVLITPVYWGGLSEVMKLFLDRLLRCQGSKQWNKDSEITSFMDGKPCILTAVAGGSGGGGLRALHELEHFVWCISGKIYDYISVTRWNQEYKRKTLCAAVKAMQE